VRDVHLIVGIFEQTPEKVKQDFIPALVHFEGTVQRENYRKEAEYTQYVKDIYQNYLHKDDKWKIYINTIG
jgi:hypothetical protein